MKDDLSVLANSRPQAANAIDLSRPGLMRLPTVLLVIPVSRSSWYLGVKRGIYPAPVSLGLGRAKGYRTSDIKALVESLGQEVNRG